MSETPTVDFESIAKKLVSRVADLEYQVLQWESLGQSLQTELQRSRAEAESLKASAPAVTNGPEVPTEEPPVPA